MKIVIAEKPSVARELAKVFGATIKKDGYIEGKGYCFTWAFGHLLQLAPPQEYGYIGWRRQHLPMLPLKFKLGIRKIKTKDGLVEDPGVRKQLDIIKALFAEATEIIVATDAGREGELIFRYS
jgi:DNA topoisomerase-3